MMADSNTQQLLSPADYMRLVGRVNYKLRAHEALIRQLMEAGFNDHRIWRYLIDVAGIKVSRATAARFCKALRAGSISAPPGEANRSVIIPEAATPSPRPTDAGLASSPASPAAQPGTHVTGGEIGGAPRNAAGQQTHQAAMNDATERGAFVQPQGGHAPTIEASAEPRQAGPGNVIKTFSASTPAARQMLRDFHRKLKEQGEGNSK